MSILLLGIRPKTFLPETDTFISRIEANSGSVNDPKFVNRFVRHAKKNNYWQFILSGNMIVQFPSFATRLTTGNVNKLYDIHTAAFDSFQTVGAAQGVYVADDLNGKSAIDLDGSNDDLLFGGAALDFARNRNFLYATVLINHSINSNFPQIVICSTNTSTDNRFSLGRNSSNEDRLVGRRLDAVAQQIITSASPLGTLLLTGYVDYTNTAGRLFRNGSVVASSDSFLTAGSTSDTASALMSIGGLGVNHVDGKFYGLVMANVNITAYRSAIESFIIQEFAL